MSAKSHPGDGSHGRGVKGRLAESDHHRPWDFLRSVVRGLRALRHR